MSSEPATPTRLPKVDWPVVVLAGLVLAAIVALVALGQELSAVVGGVVLIAGLLGYNTMQNAVNRSELGQVKDLANGNNSTLVETIRAERLEHNRQMADQHAATLRMASETQALVATICALLPAGTHLPVQAGTLARPDDQPLVEPRGDASPTGPLTGSGV